MKLIWQNNTPYSTKFKDIYFDIKNGLEESLYVFIKGNKLEERWNKNCENNLKAMFFTNHDNYFNAKFDTNCYNNFNAKFDTNRDNNFNAKFDTNRDNSKNTNFDISNNAKFFTNHDNSENANCENNLNTKFNTNCDNSENAKFNNETFNIAELGFGSGLNFSLTSKIFLEQNNIYKKLNFYSCEKFPLSINDIIKIKKNFESLDKYFFSWIDSYNYNLSKISNFAILENFNTIWFESFKYYLNKVSKFFYNLFHKKKFIKINLFENKIFLNLFFGDVKDFLHLLIKNKIFIDAWYMDGFSPKNNPEMWSEKVCKKMEIVSNQNATLATFSSAGVVKRALLKSNWKIRKQKGFNKKREMITGIR